MSTRIYALTIITGLISGLVIALSSTPPVAGVLVLVVAPDVPPRERRVVEAGRRIVGLQQAVFGSFTISENPNFAAALRASGVWFVADGRQISPLCGVAI